MSPTLADVYMITGLRVTGNVYPHKYRGSSKQTGVKTRIGYKRYIQNYMSDGPLTNVEYSAFMTCGYADLSFVAKPISQPRTIF
jgi:hypothetical protein